MLAVDLDETAVRVATENIAFNQVGDRVTVRLSDLNAQVASVQFDIVVANLLADLVIKLVPGIRRHLRPGGFFVGSGIVENQAEDVVAALEMHQFAVTRMSRQADWLAIRARWEG